MTKATQTKAINSAVKAHFSDGVSINNTANILLANGVGFTDIESTVHSVGVTLGLVLTTEKIKQTVDTVFSAEKKPANFFEVIQLAKKIDLVQLSDTDKLELTGKYFNVKSKDTKYTGIAGLTGSTKWGKLLNWIRENKDFTPVELISASNELIDSKDNADFTYPLIAMADILRSKDV